MIKVKRILTAFAVLTIVSAGSVSAMAAGVETPAEIVAGLTGRTVEEVAQERFESGKPYGTIANEAGKLEEFQESSCYDIEEILDRDVANGYLAQEEAGEILSSIQARQAYCAGNGFGARGGYGPGAGYGRGQGFGRRCGAGPCMYYHAN